VTEIVDWIRCRYEVRLNVAKRFCKGNLYSAHAALAPFLPMSRILSVVGAMTQRGCAKSLIG
jgi:hypothetical protein